MCSSLFDHREFASFKISARQVFFQEHFLCSPDMQDGTKHSLVGGWCFDFSLDAEKKAYTKMRSCSHGVRGACDTVKEIGIRVELAGAVNWLQAAMNLERRAARR